jgi:hypothetical protein
LRDEALPPNRRLIVDRRFVMVTHARHCSDIDFFITPDHGEPLSMSGLVLAAVPNDIRRRWVNVLHPRIMWS